MIHCSQIAKSPTSSPKAFRIQWKIPPSSENREENSAERSATGNKKVKRTSKKKKGSEFPKRAVAGRLRMLSIAAMIKKIKEKREIFCICTTCDSKIKKIAGWQDSQDKKDEKLIYFLS
ncbi:MAG TPA: hypothetical protein VJK48_05545 [Chlamydiales bacterium]|nr:hypothetical protein [Chlamydiales bacterium]